MYLKKIMALHRYNTAKKAHNPCSSQSMLYTLADKFLDKAELDEIKEVMRMTRLGQMLMDEGMELKETDSIKKLMKNMNLTIDQAMNALEVPADKREKYRKTITPDN